MHAWCRQQVQPGQHVVPEEGAGPALHVLGVQYCMVCAGRAVQGGLLACLPLFSLCARAPRLCGRASGTNMHKDASPWRSSCMHTTMPVMLHTSSCLDVLAPSSRWHYSTMQHHASHASTMQLFPPHNAPHPHPTPIPNPHNAQATQFQPILAANPAINVYDITKKVGVCACMCA